MEERTITKMMLDKLRASRYLKEEKALNDFAFETKENDNFLTRSKILMQEAVKELFKENMVNEEASHEKELVIDKNTPQFGDIRTSQEEMIRKTIGDNVVMDSNALKFYPLANDMTLDGKIPSLNMTFQFRFADPSGDGVYVWTDGLQVTETNLRTIGKVRDAFLNWRQGIVQDADLMEKLKRAYERNNEN